MFDDLPDDVREEIAPHAGIASRRLEAVSQAIARKRDEAREARTASGIELTWRACEEAYAGIDDANRHEQGSSPWSKPQTMAGPLQRDARSPAPDYRSTVNVRMTGRYVDAAAAKIGEILLPPDDKSFSITETPRPDLVEAKKDIRQVLSDDGIPLTRPLKPGEAPPIGPVSAAPAASLPGAPAAATAPPVAAPAAGAILAAGAVAPPVGAPVGAPGALPQEQRVPLTPKDLAEETIEIAREAAEEAEEQIHDWLVECQHTSEVRKVLHDAARIGVGVLKGPFAKPIKAMAANAVNNGIEVQIEQKVQPATKWVDPWNCFPDSACGENIHYGDYFLERDYMSERQLRTLKDIPGYIASQIDRVIEEGPDKQNAKRDDGTPPANDQSKTKGRYELWFFYGMLDRDDMQCLSTTGGKPLDEKALPKGKRQVYVIATLVNDHVIRATFNPLDSGSFPYLSMPWQRRTGHWAGVGVAEQVSVPQRMLNAATRAMLNNAGKSSGSQIVIDQGSIVPADGLWAMTPDKVWYKTAEGGGQSVQNAFMAVQIPNMTEELMLVVNYAQRLAEESTSIPLITQGQSGPTTPDTFGAAQLQNNNANQLLRSIGYEFDDHITEPLIRMMYEWYLLDPAIPREKKGDFQINAHGSVALVERALQDQTIAQLAQIVLNPAYGLDPKRWASTFLKSKRINPTEMKFSKEEQEQMEKAPAPAAPQIEVAKIRAAVDEKKIALTQASDAHAAQIAEADAALDAHRVNNETAIAQSDNAIDMRRLEMEREIAILKFANDHQMKIEQVKAALAGTAMKLNLQRELSMADKSHENRRDERQQQKQPRRPRPAPQVATPPSEPAGRAPTGQAFQA